MNFPKQKGFTLLELMIAVALIAVMITLGVPAFDDALERRRAQGTVEEVKTRIAIARSEAIKRNQPVSVAFMRGAGGQAWCMGLRNNDTAGCNCQDTAAGTSTNANHCGFDDDFTTAPAPVDQYFSSPADDRIDLTADPDFNGDMVFAFSPTEGTLTNLADTGDITLATEEGNYEFTIEVSPIGLTSICYTANSKKLGRYQPCP